MFESAGARAPPAQHLPPGCGGLAEAVPCDFCGNAESVLYCTADRAHLCLECDRKVHCANSLAERHVRTWICSNCRAGPAEVLCLHDGAALCRACDAAVHRAPHAAHHKRQSLPPVPPASLGGYALPSGGGRPIGSGDSLFDSFLESLDGPQSLKQEQVKQELAGQGGRRPKQPQQQQRGPGRAAGSSSSGEATYSGLEIGGPSPMLFYGMQAVPPAPPSQEPPKKPKRRGRPRKEEVAARAAARAAAQATLAKKYAYEQELKRREARMRHMMQERGAGRAGPALPSNAAFDGNGVPPRGAEEGVGGGGGPPSNSGGVPQFGDEAGAPSVGLRLNNIQEGVVIRHEGGRYEWLDKSPPSDGGALAVPGDPTSEGPDAKMDSRAMAIARYKEKRLKRRYTNNLRYANRKDMADKRVRNKGRFVKKGDTA